MEKSVRDFVSEAEEILEEMSQDLLALSESTGELDPDLLNRLFRGAHSLKGLAGMFGFSQLSQIAHRSEDLMDALRLGKLSFTSQCRSLLEEGIALLREGIALVHEGRGEMGEEQALPYLAKVERFLKVEQKGRDDDPLAEAGFPSDLTNVLTEYEEHRLKTNLRKGNRVLRIAIAYPLETFEEALSRATAIIKEKGELITNLPDPENQNPETLNFDMLVGTPLGAEELLSALQEFAPRLKEVYELKGASPRPPAPLREPQAAGEAAPPSLRSISQTVRVDIEHLDQMMSLVGELLMVRSGMQRLLKQLERENVPATLVTEMEKRLKVADRKLEELRKRMMDVRMVPLKQVFDKLQRVVNKLSKELGKKVQVEVYGSETELDKVIVEELVDPLMHLVRNALDHGIEPPEERKKKGKPEAGKLVFSAYQKGNHVVIEVRDDGRGIEVERIERKAIEKGLLPGDHRLPPREILNFIFAPGFSTKEEVSEVSGRGVGLDVVKNNITRLKGMIDVRSEPGKGTTFELTLPMTLAIIQALVIQSGPHRFAIPLNEVQESLQIQADKIQYLEGRPVFDHRGSWIFLSRLEELFDLPLQEEPREEFYVVLVGVGERRLGILVDELLGEESIVLKPLRSILRNVKGISGACDQGDRAPLLVLDVSSLLESSRHLYHYGATSAP